MTKTYCHRCQSETEHYTTKKLNGLNGPASDTEKCVDCGVETWA